MKAIILAAGEGTRLKPITNIIPKPLIKIYGKSIIGHNLESLKKFVDEIIIVINKKNQEIIKKTIGNNYKKIKIKYHLQGDHKGTSAAIKDLDIKGDFIVLYGDSIYGKKDIGKVIKDKEYGCLVKKVENTKDYGIFMTDENLFATKIVEKPIKNIGNLANMGGFKFNENIIELAKKTKKSIRGEYEITDPLNEFLKQYKFKLHKLNENIIDISYPWDILTANKYFLDKLKKNKIKGKKEKNVVIKGNIILEKGAILKSGTYIEGNCYIGKDSIIGPNCFIRGNTVIGSNCKIGNAVEIKNSSIGDNTNISHLSYIGDSIIGNNVNIGGGFIVANLRHDRENIKVPIKGELKNTGLKKFGCVIGDNTKIGTGNTVYPGRVIDINSRTLPGEIIK